MKKIIFKDKYGLTNAVLQGRKTMTRRIIRNLSDFDPRQDWMHWSDNGKANIAIIHNETYKYSVYPQYQPGEVVAVAQSYNDVYEELKHTHGSSSRVTREFFHKYVQGGRMPVNNKMFVKAALMPHRIRITNIKVERLQDISDGDCLEEGINQVDMGFSYRCPRGVCTFSNPKEAFASLIDAISGKGTWALNPFVLSYTFVLID